MSVITNRPRDCLACRLIGGFGLTGVGAYIGYHGYGKTGYGRLGMFTVAAVAASLGMARIFNLPPFGISFPHNCQQKLPETEQEQLVLQRFRICESVVSRNWRLQVCLLKKL